ncbi:hypothetical protein [Legionella micdadei]|uniref:hypothetical protein n=1 Tax=Legionella micdadei TaxID=451 RepID=UPI0009EF7BB0|nr:hypothetical protein [Legionella micdadei]ARH01643.1 hypothetical protein B6V88_12210 [Legionella micdadei]
MTKYCIQAAMFKLPIPFLKCFTHNFWVLRDIESNSIVAQLHGLATSRKTGEIVPIGYRRDHSLKAHCMIYNANFARRYHLQRGTYALPLHAYHTVYEGEDCVQLWLQALKAVEAINELNLDYPPGGFKIPLSASLNSNSIYHTFARVMNIPLHIFPGFFQIGIKASVFELIR